ncbi:MAG: HAMP domain-containing histidine kinase [Acidobacteria bacterium]|nr:HAMP domain-containing histidine kinase [Acidobacteriota bacterium]
MGVNPRFSLSTKFALLALLNVALLAVVFVVFVRWQLSEELESFLMSTARDRISSVSRSLALEMQQHDRSHWSRLLQQYSDEQGVTFMLIQTDGQVMAGPELELPAVVQERLVRPPQRGIPGFNLFREWKGPGPPPEPPVNREEELRRMQREMKAAGRELKAAGREIKEAESEMRRRYFRTIPYFNPTPPLLVVSEGATPYWVGVRLMLPPDGEGEPVRASLLLVSSTFYSNPFFFQLRPWLWIAAAAIVVSFLCWLPLVHGLTQSTARMMRATAEIAEGKFDVHVGDTRRDELGLLGAAINRMSSRLETFTRGQKRFLGDVAHELRSPLARMQLALGILERKAGPDGQSYVRDLMEDVETMAGLTDELLAFAKAELSAGSIKLEPVNVLDGVQRAVRAEAREGAAVEVNVASNLAIMADPDFLFRSVSNLLRNAVRYAGSGGPIAISAERRGGQVRIAVADSGPGIPEQAVDKIFTPFFRLDESRNRRTGGTGLGLAIVRSCVEACHGSVEARNRKPHGLEVVMTFTAADGSGRESQELAAVRVDGQGGSH